MSEHKPKRHYLNYGLYDEVTDSVKGSDGKEHVVTMRGWHWNNLDWVNSSANVATEAMLVDGAIIGLFEEKQIPPAEREYKEEPSLSKSLEACIYFFIEAYHNGRMKDKATDSGGKATVGRA